MVLLPKSLNFRLRTCLIVFLWLVANTMTSWGDARPDTSGGPNIVSIAVDDLRPERAAFGAAHMKTPTHHHLANERWAIARGSFQSPSCDPFRFALLAGHIPETTAYTKSNADFIREELVNSDAMSPGSSTADGSWACHLPGCGQSQPLRKLRHRGRENVDRQFRFTATADNIVRWQGLAT